MKPPGIAAKHFQDVFSSQKTIERFKLTMIESLTRTKTVVQKRFADFVGSLWNLTNGQSWMHVARTLYSPCILIECVIVSIYTAWYVGERPQCCWGPDLST